MNRNRIILLTLILAVTLEVAACSSAASAPTTVPTSPPGSTSTSAPAVSSDTASASTAAIDTELARTDSQGAVEFVVTPLNLSSPGKTLDFKVVMDTHTVDLGWDLAAQSTVTTEAGLEVNGQSWPIGSGHHYESTLSFPSQTADGKALLDGATTLKLTIRNTDVAERIFVWELTK